MEKISATNIVIRPIAAFTAMAAAILFFAATGAKGQSDREENLGPNVNTEYAELVPIVSPDGKTLYFDRKNAPMNTGGISDPDDIYYSNLQADGTWGPAINIGAPLNTPGSDVLFWLSPDGNTALVYYGKRVNDEDVGLSLTRKVKGTWSEPKKVIIDGLKSLGDYYYAHMSADGKRLFLAYAPAPEKDRYNFDIFYAPAVSNDYMHWGQPLPLPQMVNTPFSEGAPFIAADNRTLYFISDRPENYGQSDVYMVRRTGDDWMKWTPPTNMGEFVNTPMYEAGISVPASGDWLYTSRLAIKKEDEAYGRTDLFRVKLPEDLRPKSGYLLSGALLDKVTGSGVSGLVRISDVSSGREISTTASKDDGSFSAVVISGLMYKIEGSAAGYSTQAVTLDFRYGIPEDLEPTKLLLDPSDAGITPTILFASGSAQVSKENQTKLQRLYKSLSPLIKQNKIDRIDVIGHTDSVGVETDNQSLSEQRAEAVRSLLVHLGIPSTMLKISGQGEGSPLATNGTLSGRATNRRVEINVEYNTTAKPDRKLPSMIPLPRE